MLLVHSQIHHPMLNPVPLSHRRNPSAPPRLAVLPTRTPGLLSLSKPKDAKPAKVLLSKSPRAQKQPKQSQAPTTDDEREPKVTSTTAVPPSTPTVERQAPLDPQTPDKHQRERPRTRTDKDSPRKQPRSASQAAPRTPQHSQAEAHNSDSDSPSKTSPRKRPQRTSTAPPSPVATLGQPSGRLAKNRRARHKASSSEVAIPAPSELVLEAPSLAPSTPIAIPSRPRAPRSHPMLSRSAPLAIPAPRKFAAHTSHEHGLSDWDQVVADNLADDPTWPGTSALQGGGPRTAPLLKTPQFTMFPSSSPPPSPTTMRPSTFKHQRSPSFPTESMFFMSMDDDEGPRSADSGARPRTPLRLRNQRGVVPFLYAGSSFQNAPNPTDLPAPRFLVTP